jgi:hypothetical protein
MNEQQGEKEGLHIFVNRRKFGEAEGVRREMTGAQIAALVGMPADNTEVRIDSGTEKGKKIGIKEAVHIHDGEHFLCEPHGEKGLHIFVNRRKFEEGDGVRREMTGAQIAALVGVPADNAVVRIDSGPDKGKQVDIKEVVHIHDREHFLVTRQVVEGGHEPRTNRSRTR